jgi:hypothetical protein
MLIAQAEDYRRLPDTPEAVRASMRDACGTEARPRVPTLARAGSSSGHYAQFQVPPSSRPSRSSARQSGPGSLGSLRTFSCSIASLTRS